MPTFLLIKAYSIQYRVMSSDPSSSSSFLVRRLESARKRVKLSSKPTGTRRLCPHCDQKLSAKTFKKHRRMNCKDDNTWIRVSLEAPNATVDEEGSL